MGLYVPYAEKRDTGALFHPGPIIDESLVFHAPLWHPDLSVSPFTTKDATKHTCTVTGALWTPQGRTFVAATPSYISCGNSSLLNFTSGDFTLEMWEKTDSDGVQVLLVRGIADATGYQFYLNTNRKPLLYTSQSGADQATYLTNSMSDSVWHHIIATRVGALVVIDVDGVTPAQTSGTHINPTTSTNNLVLGVHNNLTSSPFSGLQGEVRIYSRALTAGERIHNYLATRWRYQ